MPRMLPCRAVVLALAMGTTALPGQEGNYNWSAAPLLHPGIRHASLSLTSPRLMKINCLQVDVTTPGLGFKATPRADNWQPGVRETITMTTRQFISNSQTTDSKLVAAVNCQAWKMEGPDWDKPVPVYLLLGMAVSDGVLVTPGTLSGHIALVIDRSGTPEIKVAGSSLDLGGINIVGSGFVNGYLLRQGTPTGDNVSLNPRTGIGVSGDKRYLYLMTIDGRQPASAGATELEVAQWLKHFGSYEGMNADGGGSTTLAWWDPAAAGTDKSKLLNSPRGDGLSGSSTITERYVGHNIGMYYDMPVIYWTGNEDRWGGGSLTATADDNFTRLPGGTEWRKLSNGESYHHVYDRSAGTMPGTNFSVLMNRADNTLGSLTLVGDAQGNGFDLNLAENTSNGAGIRLAGEVNVSSGAHTVRRANEGTNVNTLALTAQSVWNVAANASLAWSIPLTGSFGLTKAGAGTAILSGAHSHTGPTFVHGGTLTINGSQPAATGAVMVGGAAATGAPTLGGTGTLGGSVIIRGANGGAPGTLAPGGTSAGTLGLGNNPLTLESGARLAYRLGTASDSVAGVGTLALNGQQWSDFTFTPAAGFGPGIYRLIDAASFTGNLGVSRSGTINGYNGTLSVTSGNDLVLTVTGDGNVPVTATINQAADQADTTTASSIRFTVVFSEPVTGFQTGDVTLRGTAGATTAVVTGGGTTYQVTVSGMNTTGTVIAELAAGVAQGLTGNPSAASTSTDNTVDYVRNSNNPMWDGGAGTGNWSTAANWNPDVLGFNSPTDLIFQTPGAGNLATFLGSSARTIRSLVFNADADSDVVIRIDDNSTTGKQLVFQSDNGTSAIMVEKGAMGNFTIDSTTSGGRAQMNNNLIIDHNGSGTLTLRRLREISGNNYSLTKTGSGILVYGNTSAYSYDGPTIINGGTFRYAASDALLNGPVSIGNATLDAATFTDTVGTLSITGAATIHLGNGAALAFGDSSAVDWTGGALSITGGFVSGTSLRFGTTANGLTPAQLARISAAGIESFSLDANGYLIDAGPLAKPAVKINQAASQADPTDEPPVNFTVEFSRPVTGFTPSDVTTGGTATGARTVAISGSGTTYTVAVGGLTGNGTVTASIAADVVDGGNEASTSTDNTVTCNVVTDTTPPTVTINKKSDQADPTDASPINFTVVFSETVTGFATGDVTLGGTAGATTAVVSGSGTTYNVAVSGMTTDGTVIASLAAGVAQDLAGNPNTASTSTGNTVNFVLPRPAVTINQAAGQADPTNAPTINFTAVFSAAVTGFDGNDVTLGGTAGATTAVVTQIPPNNGTTYNVAVSGMTGEGTVTASIAADVTDGGNQASTSTDNTVTYSTSIPITWTGGGADESWSTNENWNVIPTSGNTTDIIFYSAAARLTNFLGSARTIRSLSFNDSADSNVTIRLQSILANTGGARRDLALASDSGTSTIAVDSGATGNFTFTSGYGGQMAVNNDLVIDHNGSGNLQFRNINDASLTAGPFPTVTKNGTGTLRVGGTSSLRGNVVIHAGTLGLGGVVAPSGNLFRGAVTINGGSLDVATFAQTVENGGVVTLQSGTITGTTGSLATTTAFEMHSGSVSAILAGSGGLNKSTAGTLTLSGANTYSGATAIAEGTLALGAGNTIPDASAITLGAATLDAATFTDTAGTLDVTGAATIHLGSGGALAFADSSAIDWTGGTLAITGSFVPGSSLRFGTTANSLTAGQLAQISVPGIHALALNDTGYLIEGTALKPTVTINQKDGQADPTNASPIEFTVVFSASVTGFEGSDVTLGGTAGATTAEVTGSGTTYNVAVSGMTGNGTVTASIAADVVDGGNEASTSTDNEVTYTEPVTGFALWQQVNETEGGLDADHDGDGVTNGVEYFLGGGTDTTGPTALPAVVNTAGVLSITWTKAADYTGVYGTHFRVETSDTLAGGWTAESVPGGTVAVSGNNVTYTFPAPLGARKFVRLAVTGP